MRKPKITALLVGMTMLNVAVLLSTSACGGETGGEAERGPFVDESKPLLQADGPLRGLIMAKGVTEKRTIVDPGFSFGPDERKAFAVITLGNDTPEGAVLEVTWYRLAGTEARERLFAHQLEVGPDGMAYSEGVAPGGLAPGLYETVATLGEWQVRVPWVVRDASESAGMASASDAMSGASPGFTRFTRQASKRQLEPSFSNVVPLTIFVQADSQAPEAEPGSWEAPYPGDSGYLDEFEKPTIHETPTGCQIDSINPGMVPLTDVEGSAFSIGPCSFLRLSAAVTGLPVTLASNENPELPIDNVYGQMDVCRIPGGSDMPGTVVKFEANGSDGATLVENFTLPDLGESLATAIEGEPASGSRVKAGDRIRLQAVAMVMAPAQGIEVLYADDGEQLIESVGNTSGSGEPRSCDPGRFFAGFGFGGPSGPPREYTVPSDPPPVIEICANAVGFDGHRVRDCIKYYTGEVWEGSYRGVTSAPGCDPYAVLEGQYAMVIGAEGSATLEGTGKHTIVCGGESASAGAGFNLTAQKTASGFHIEGGIPGAGVFPQGLDIRVQGNRGEGAANYALGGGASVSLSFTMECTSCSAGG